MYQTIKNKNQHIRMMHVTQSSVRPYGRMITGYDFSELIDYMHLKTAIPQEGNRYLPAIQEMEHTALFEHLMHGYYGGMPIQIGYCNGQNTQLNGLEYHKGREIVLAITDLVLLLGHVQDIKEKQYHSENVVGVFVPKETAIELYATTLHFAPCKVHKKGFKSSIILPEGTNSPINYNGGVHTYEEGLLFKKNKWLLVHSENTKLMRQDAYVGIIGENTRVNYVS
ncbi:DUF4867 family protein [Vallitalea pronyensis]|uniref:DUF4867 family protein n=1 Tax=Vallitalea pronyensis TaxID=1348613 RepID=A0A8J8MLX0_9FIRM|nr:DUF4867 family protein [Vallitalea pronyensis]QUI23678.1 DUF4867 family protein [Vallitalea pronyensis]